MAECQFITHEIVRGDTLYRLAQKYRTTVPLILLANPGVDPYNLQVGTRLRICRGNQVVQRPSMDEMQMAGDLGKLWMQYSNWLKLYLESLSQSAARQREVAQRVEQAAGKIVDVFALFYPDAMVTKLRDAFVRQYTLSLLSLANAVNNRDTMAQEQFGERVEEYAEMVAALLSQYNRNYNKDDLEEKLEQSPEVAERIVLALRNGDSMAEFSGFEQLDDWAADLGVVLAEGLQKEFYREG
ncbi:MAG: LysM peptidoglycan-binding domain-containing protein [Lachnospiraceae bacterium]|nr:LysM peptidoglycan-binding domain-containing protein [Lachnospiraceae bacterium]